MPTLRPGIPPGNLRPPGPPPIKISNAAMHWVSDWWSLKARVSRWMPETWEVCRCVAVFAVEVHKKFRRVWARRSVGRTEHRERRRTGRAWDQTAATRRYRPTDVECLRHSNRDQNLALSSKERTSSSSRILNSLAVLVSYSEECVRDGADLALSRTKLTRKSEVDWAPGTAWYRERTSLTGRRHAGRRPTIIREVCVKTTSFRGYPFEARCRHAVTLRMFSAIQG